MPSPSYAVSDLPEPLASVCHRTLQFDDVIKLARDNAPGFRLVTHDTKNNIKMYTAPVEASPIHMMKASVTMPCSPSAFLRYLDFDVRSMWDEHFIEGQVIHQFSKDDVTVLRKAQTNNTDEVLAGGSSLSGSPSSISSSSSSSSWSAPITLQLKHVGFLSPVPLLTDRDFELIVAESFDERTGVAILKALSPPIGAIYPTTAAKGGGGSGKYVRGLISLSGFVVSPVRYVDPVLRRDIDGCSVTYIALVHPMGLIPPALVNIVVGKQTAGLLQLQAFMRQHPVASLPPRPEEEESSGKRRVVRVAAAAGANQRRKSKL